ncbi:5'-deoxyadenosine deaminase [Methylobacterium hispanicum]|uniref:5'-deoxyadenosine deaminase n=1 Tax=Methylobacterium hispanicum TaxID=270350 RepID=A0AAV4ZSX6_9HYPH|nr:amidohydrolase family protein [Methylobacterium hispanicum]GJD91582.1 5'-deoxyadenosine deaminase [Methylobacterium hispanicum]
MGRFLQVGDEGAPEPRLLAAGPERTVLSGRIVTLDGSSTVHPAGFVCIEGDTIAAVAGDAKQLPAEFGELKPIRTQGTIFPGLIELHNHLPYNMLPLWDVPQRYTNRMQWRNDYARYAPEIRWPAKVLGSNPDLDYQRAIARYVECRALFGGTTTAQGLSRSDEFYRGLIRNVEDPGEEGWPVAHGRTDDARPRFIREDILEKLRESRPFFYHLAEGTDAEARRRFLDLDMGSDGWAIDRHLIAIHCTGLRPEDFGRLSAAAGMVWSPLSNFLLYGRTAHVEAALKGGVRIALGSDWSPSGSKNLLGELKVARIVDEELGGPFGCEALVRMVTSTPAAMLGWDGFVGSIEKGKRADLLILAGDFEEPYEQLVSAVENQILAVMVAGRPRLGRRGLLHFAPEQQETVRIGGQAYTLDLAEASGPTLNGLSLASAVAKLTYGLANMPELARTYAADTCFLVRLAEQGRLPKALLDAPWGIELELDPDLGRLRENCDKASEIDQTLIRRLSLPPLTEIDDPSFRGRIRDNVNLPAFLRDRL